MSSHHNQQPAASRQIWRDPETQAKSLPLAELPLFDVRFNGPEYVPELDKKRLTGQILRVFTLMRDGQWRTLDEIAAATGDPHASISAQLRHLRKARFGSHTVERRPRGERCHGLYEYRVTGAHA